MAGAEAAESVGAELDLSLLEQALVVMTKAPEMMANANFFMVSLVTPTY